MITFIPINFLRKIKFLLAVGFIIYFFCILLGIPTVNAENTPTELPAIEIFDERVDAISIENKLIKASIKIDNTSDEWHIGGLSYGIRLYVEDKNGGDIIVTTSKGDTYLALIDEWIDQNIFSLAPREQKSISFDYNYPDGLPSGNYVLQPTLYLNSGIVISSVDLPVSLVDVSAPANFALLVDKASCRIQKLKNFSLNAGVGALIEPNLPVVGRCSVKNTLNAQLNVKGVYSTRYYQGSFLNKIIETKELEFTFTPNETKQIEITFSAQQNGGSYQSLFYFKDQDKQISMAEIFKWTVRGESAKVLAVYSNNNIYQSGENAKIALAYTGPADLYWRDNEENDPTVRSSASTTILQGFDIILSLFSSDKLCGDIKMHVDEFNFAKAGAGADYLMFDVPIKIKCENPKVSIDIIKDNKSLSALSVDLPSQNIKSDKKSNWIIYLIIGVAILLLVVIIEKYLKIRFSKKILIALIFIFTGLMSFFLFGKNSFAGPPPTITINVTGVSNQVEKLGADSFLYETGNPPQRVYFNVTAKHIGCKNGDNRKVRIRGQIKDGGTAIGGKTAWIESGCKDWADSRVFKFDDTKYSGASTYDKKYLTSGKYSLEVEVQWSKNNWIEFVGTTGNYGGYYLVNGQTVELSIYNLLINAGFSENLFDKHCSNDWSGEDEHIIKSDDFYTRQDFNMSLALSSASSGFTQGNSTSIAWTLSGSTPDSCTASSAWSGSKNVSGGTEVVGSTLAGGTTHNYILNCSKTYTWGTSGSKFYTKSATASTYVYPKCTVSLGLNPTSVISGDSTLISWSGSNVQNNSHIGKCYLTSDNGVTYTNISAPSGSKSSGNISSNTNYKVKCTTPPNDYSCFSSNVGVTVQACAPDTQQSCVASVPSNCKSCTASQTCNSSGSAWGACNLTFCEPNTGYEWNSTTKTCQPVLGLQSITVGKLSNGSGTIEDIPPAGFVKLVDCGASCNIKTFVVPTGGVVMKLKATPSADSNFISWDRYCGIAPLPSCSSTQINVPIALGEHVVVGARFTKKTFVATFEKTGSGTGGITGDVSCATAPCTKTVNYGDTIAFGPSPNDDSYFEPDLLGLSGGPYWSSDAVNVGWDWAKFENIIKNVVTKANFQIKSFSVLVSLGGSCTGSVSGDIDCSSGTCSSNFNYGQDVVLDASPDSGCVFSGWSGDCSGTGTCEISSLTSGASVEADFESICTPSSCGTDYICGDNLDDGCGGTLNCGAEIVSCGEGDYDIPDGADPDTCSSTKSCSADGLGYDACDVVCTGCEAPYQMKSGSCVDLSVKLSATPNPGAINNDINVLATASGLALSDESGGNITFTFKCFDTDTPQTNINADEADSSSAITCKYPVIGTYTASVTVDHDGISASSDVDIEITDVVTISSLPKPGWIEIKPK